MNFEFMIKSNKRFHNLIDDLNFSIDKKYETKNPNKNFSLRDFQQTKSPVSLKKSTTIVAISTRFSRL